MLSQITAVLIAALVSAVLPCAAEMPGKVDVEATELAAEFIGAPVFARDGEQVGNVADLSFDDEGQPLALRMRISLHLGLGTRTIQVSNGAFFVLRGFVMLEIPTGAVQSVAEITGDEK